jgi:cytochrome c-type biogenesis protein CcmE
VYAFISGASPYVTAKEAAKLAGKEVHVAGRIDHASAKSGGGTFSFVLVDDAGDSLQVNYAGMKPGNFDTAPTASIAGTYKEGVFVAERITTQCPSKYETVQKPGKQ